MRALVKASLVLVGAVLLSGCQAQLCDTTNQENVDDDKQAIVGGSGDATHRSTVALILTMPDGTRGLCSGSIIAKDEPEDGQPARGYVLTAGHCAEGTVASILQATDF